jgi:hypothetical protein
MTPLTPADASRSVGPCDARMPGVPVTPTRAAGPLTVTATCVALFAAGCGSGQSTPPFNTATAMSDALRIVVCMRSHGVPTMPDPQVFHSGGKTGIVMPDPGSAANSPAFKSAQEACHALKSGAAIPNTSQAASALAQRRKQGLAFAVCMRSHGVPNFPDPNNQGLFTSKLHASAPQVQAANKACQTTLPTGADPLSGEPTPAP